MACTWKGIWNISMRQLLPIGTISAKTTNSGSITPSLYLQVLSKPVQEVMCGLVLAAEEVWGESAQQKMILLHQLLFDTHLPRRIWHLAFFDSQDLAFGIFDTAIWLFKTLSQAKKLSKKVGGSEEIYMIILDSRINPSSMALTSSITLKVLLMFVLSSNLFDEVTIWWILFGQMSVVGKLTNHCWKVRVLKDKREVQGLRRENWYLQDISLMYLLICIFIGPESDIGYPCH